jgi:hypothetical protein
MYGFTCFRYFFLAALVIFPAVTSLANEPCASAKTTP